MRIIWDIADSDKERVRCFVEGLDTNHFVAERRRRNLQFPKQPVTEANFWRQMVAARCTSRQRSGPSSAVARFLSSSPFPLRYDALRSRTDVAEVISDALTRSGGIRFSGQIGKDLAANLHCLEQCGKWSEALGTVNRLTARREPAEERDVARYVQNLLAGFGPKQSRNLLQALGLTRHEIPIDSRITGWLNNLGFPIKLTGGALADTQYYEFVLDGVQALCRACDILPCELDAAIFAAVDGDQWTPENLVF